MTRRLAPGRRLVLATHNAGKVREFERLLAPHGVTVVGAASLGLAEPDETAADVAGNAALKARAAAAASGLPSLADDSGFGLAALDGAPGVHSARFAGPGKDFDDAMRRLHDLAAPHPVREAAFTCVLALAWPDGEVRTFTGRSEGVWVWPPRGAGGFGYDPMFQPAGETRTFAEMDGTEKARLGHRGRAFALFAAACLPEPADDRGAAL